MAKSQSVYDEPEVQASSGFVIDSDVAIGARTRFATRTAKYPFDQLDVGQSFHVPATAAMPKPGTTLAGAVTNANNKWSSDHPSEIETKQLANFAVDENGKRLRNADGSYQKNGTKTVSRPVRVAQRHFTIRSTDHTDPRGPGARVFRDL